MNNISIVGEKCTGCLACIDICPVNAISIKENEDGFVYPYVNHNRCISCGACNKVCQKISIPKKCSPIVSYAVACKDDSKVTMSTSAGVFYNLADYVLSKLNGVVFGAYMDDAFVVKHIEVDNRADLYKIQGSKYVQSSTLGVFKKILDLLKNDRIVLFSGTPCQVSGLSKYLSQKKASVEGLFTVDLICHGVPSNSGLIEYLRKYYRGTKTLTFRSRYKYMSNYYGFNIVDNNGNIRLVTAEYDPWYSGFLYENSYRESCYSCEFTCKDRVGDITLGDCANARKYVLEDVNLATKSMSTVMCNTEKGIDLFEHIKMGFDIYNNDIEVEAKLNKMLHTSAHRSELRDSFYYDINNCGLFKLKRKYTKCFNLPFIVKNFIFTHTSSKNRWKVRRCIKKLCSKR